MMPDGSLAVTDRDAHALFRVNPTTGAQSLITSGVNLVDPMNVVVSAGGDLIVCDTAAFGGPGGLIRINAVCNRSSGDTLALHRLLGGLADRFG